MGHEPVIVLDNGGSSCKIGLAGQSEPYRVFPNAIGRAKGERQSFVADQLLSYRDASSLVLKRPFDRGYLVNWDVEKAVWWRAFKSLLQMQPQDCGLLMTEPPFNLPSIQASTLQMVFEEYGFRSFAAMPAQPLSLRAWAAERADLPAAAAGVGVVVDAGFSFTHAVPLCDGRVLWPAVRRVNLGGKALTNYLKELVSYRSINMMEETYLVEHIKDTVCFVSADLRADLAGARAGAHRLEYVLPDGVNEQLGHVRQPQPRERGKQAAADKSSREQVLMLNNERFMVPEVLFQPSDIGLEQAGLAQTIVDAVEAAHPDLHPLLYSNVLCTGGSAKCPGFRDRLYKELRPLVPDDIEVGVHMPSDPVLAAWKGASAFATSPDYSQQAITKAHYEEMGYERLLNLAPDAAKAAATGYYTTSG
ncbi:Actin/actin-like protein [Coccomyxa subellipsoidea C-169]|uniref:Actin/actin-like protein n=1 Tax=Coccomyxa subellipsoidea (strain C-169) TaxID=574566 RepID=I0Z5Z6_COCSC|nr:Actin/actin-like protein [Coccomyxa subellipsoidea C-169]EIE26065.1 Actin/actin-like protein [Coccomyxa subellipsoidea C-169]|eukprot:XP_005650609.1 Actin/actin-like protein [Coccomyxa subellipsoidea C-169]